MLFIYFSIAFSLNGWTDREICEWWFTDQFVPFAMSKHVCDKPIFLNYDNHNSHETVDMQWVAFDMNVILIAFPSKTTHKTQPLDVSVFSGVQDQWSYQCDKHVAEGITMSWYNVIHEYLQVCHVITPEPIQVAFRKTGIYPLNPFIFTAEDFAPGKSFSTIAHVPPSFPDEVPTSPPVYLSEMDDTTDSEFMSFSDDIPMDCHSPTSVGDSDDEFEDVLAISPTSDDDWDEPLAFISDPFSLSFDSSLNDSLAGPSGLSDHSMIHTPTLNNRSLDDQSTPASTWTTWSLFMPIKILPALQYLPIHDDEKRHMKNLFRKCGISETKSMDCQYHSRCRWLNSRLQMCTVQLYAMN